MMDGFGRYNAGPDGLGYAPDLDDVLITYPIEVFVIGDEDCTFLKAVLEERFGRMISPDRRRGWSLK